jgi:hypothetical protein
MKLRDRLFNSFFFRNMLATFGNRTPYFVKTRVFPAYFQYKIGNYKSDYLLYFKKPPTLQAYKNEVFNKMSEYSGVGLADYLDFHYQASEDKPMFTRFLQYEVSERMKWPVSRNYKLRLQATFDWLNEKRVEESTHLEHISKDQILADVRAAVGGQDTSPFDAEKMITAFSELLVARMNQLVDAAKEKMEALTESLITGNIELNSEHNLDRLIHLHLLIQTIEMHRGSSVEKLFKRNTNMDLASTLHLHYRAFKGKQINTVQARISKASEDLKINDLKVRRLNKALTEFFY